MKLFFAGSAGQTVSERTFAENLGTVRRERDTIVAKGVQRRLLSYARQQREYELALKPLYEQTA